MCAGASRAVDRAACCNLPAAASRTTAFDTYAISVGASQALSFTSPCASANARRRSGSHGSGHTAAFSCRGRLSGGAVAQCSTQRQAWPYNSSAQQDSSRRPQTRPPPPAAGRRCRRWSANRKPCGTGSLSCKPKGLAPTSTAPPSSHSKEGSSDPPAAMPRRCSSCLPLLRVMRAASGWRLRSILACRLRERAAKSSNPAGLGGLGAARRLCDARRGPMPPLQRSQAPPLWHGPMQSWGAVLARLQR